MNCPRCDHEMIWGCDFDMDDLGYEEEGIVSYYSCPCGVQVEIVVPFEKEELV